MNISGKFKILIIFFVAILVISPIAVFYSKTVAITDNVYEDEIGKISDQDGEYTGGMGQGNAFDMFGEAKVTEPVVTNPQSSTESPTKQYEVAVKSNKKTPTEAGSKEKIVTTSTVSGTLSYEQVGKDMDVTGKKLEILPEPSEESKNSQLSAGYLVAVRNPESDYKYDGMKVEMTDKDLDIAQRLVMGEAGSMGFTGCCLVAQAMRDTYFYGHFKSIDAVRKGYGYDGSIKFKPNEAAKKAVKYILEEGHSAVKHRLLYFYNPRLCESKWHERQDYILTYKDVRFFDK